jgi:hypothetical protein
MFFVRFFSTQQEVEVVGTHLPPEVVIKKEDLEEGEMVHFHLKRSKI